MAFPRFKPDHVWTDADWASLPIKGSDLVDKLSSAGHKVLGVNNGKPELQEKINYKKLQLLVEKLLRGEASPTPSPISKSTSYGDYKPGKKRSK